MTSDCAEELKEMSMAMKEIAQAIERTNAKVWKNSEITEAKIFACNGWVKSCVGDFMIVFKIFDVLWGYGSFWFFLK
ncbi:hypothetical protein HN51_027293 [Arachis hypogaea]